MVVKSGASHPKHVHNLYIVVVVDVVQIYKTLSHKPTINI
jgi:hypothetical protein